MLPHEVAGGLRRAERPFGAVISGRRVQKSQGDVELGAAPTKQPFGRVISGVAGRLGQLCRVKIYC